MEKKKNFFLAITWLGLITGCASAPHVIPEVIKPKEPIELKASPMVFHEVQELLEGKHEIVGKSKEVIIKQYGQPAHTMDYIAGGKEREKYTFYLQGPEPAKEELQLEIYFYQDIAKGFNIYSGRRRPSEQAEKPNIGDRFLLGEN